MWRDASTRAPRLVDLRWGRRGPRVTLVGKGVCFDSGGLDLKTSAGMRLMKKDMGGAANVLGLAHMIARARPACRNTRKRRKKKSHRGRRCRHGPWNYAGLPTALRRGTYRIDAALDSAAASRAAIGWGLGT